MTHIYNFKEDTLIDELSYHKLYFKTYNTDQTINQEKVKFFVREDSNKVFVRNINQGVISEESIVYDFNLNEGDRMTVPFILCGYYRGSSVQEVEVYRKDSVEINGTILRRLHIRTIPLGRDAEWIEGIGSTQGLFEVGMIPDFGYFKLSCVYQNDEKIYAFNNITECLKASGLEELENTIKFNIYPTIVEDVLNISSLSYPLKISIVDILGREQMKEVLYSDKQINCSKLKSGIYNCRIIDKDNIIQMIKFIKR